MIITTTPTIQNYDITSYLGVINVNQVLGVNLFSDAIASFSDVFGGNSGTYRSRLDNLYRDVYKTLEEKAHSIGANGVVGVSMDFDEISGKGKNMFMLTATGTAVILTPSFSVRYENIRRIKELKDFLPEGLITQEEYEREKNNISSQFKDYVGDDSEQIRAKAVRDCIAAEEAEQEYKKMLSELEKNHISSPKPDKKIQSIYEGVKSLQLHDIELSEVPAMENDDLNDGIQELLEKGLYAEACKFYMEQTGLEAADAHSYVLSCLS